MEIFLAAQLIGAIGYGLLVLATFARTRFRFLLLDFLGLIPTAVHYVMLAAPAGAALTAFYMCADAVSALPAQSRKRLLYWAFYPLVVVLTWAFWTGPVDLLAGTGTALAIVARHQTLTWRIQALVCLSTIGWGTYGFMVESLAQVVFSIVYGTAALFNAFRFARVGPAPST